MNTKNLVVGDFKKWLLYSFEAQDFNEHFHLFNALKSGSNAGNVRMSRDTATVDTVFIVSHDQVVDDLQITENQKTQMIKYLIDNYFHTEDVDTIYREKTQQSDKLKNHGIVSEKDNRYQDKLEKVVVRQHPKESLYYNIQLIISVMFYVVVLGVLGYSLMINITFLYFLAALIPFALFLFLIKKLVMSFFIGMIKGNSIRVTKDQYPEVYQIIEEQAARLGLDKLPEIYVTGGHFNAFVTQFSRAKFLQIYSEVIETSLTGNYDVLKYVTAHELCHIKQKHLTKTKYLLPARFIPFLSLAYSRGCEYTCDRAGFTFSPKGSIEGVLIMTTGKEIHSKFNIETHINNALESEGFSTWFSEKFLSHPHLYKRLIELKKFSKAA
jgi:Zn-dependent protease with chaperone function